MSSVFADPPLTPKAEATRARLLEVAAEVFVERGYAAVSLRDIAVAAGVTKGAIYGHFRSKGQLLVEVIRTQLAERDSRFDAQDAVERPSSWAERAGGSALGFWVESVPQEASNAARRGRVQWRIFMGHLKSALQRYKGDARSRIGCLGPNKQAFYPFNIK